MHRSPSSISCLGYVITCGLLFGLLAKPCFAGDLGAVRQDVQNGKPRRKKKEDDHHHHHDDCHEDDHTLGHFFADVFGPPLLWTVTLPWWGPHAAVGDTFESTADFPQYPYEGSLPGYLQFVPQFSENHNSWGGHVEFDYGNDFAGMQRIGTHVLIENSSRLGLDLSANHWIEDLNQTQQENAWSGDANLVFRFAQSEHISMRSGLGVNWFEINGRGDAGVNFTYGADIFPAKPWVLKGVLDAGRVGDASLFHARGTVGVQLNRLELFTGYDYLKIGDTDLQGFLTGFAIWY